MFNDEFQRWLDNNNSAASFASYSAGDADNGGMNAIIGGSECCVRFHLSNANRNLIPLIHSFTRFVIYMRF